MQNQQTLAQRVGRTVHVSPLRYKFDSLRREFPCPPTSCIEDWLVVVANARGARVVVPPYDVGSAFVGPPFERLTNEELVVGMCQLNCLDRPQMLRPAAQLISRGAVRLQPLRRIAERERAQPVLAELSRQALKVAPQHPLWLAISDLFRGERPLREPLLHWTRLAEPIMKDGRCNAAGWKLVA